MFQREAVFFIVNIILFNRTYYIKYILFYFVFSELMTIDKSTEIILYKFFSIILCKKY